MFILSLLLLCSSHADVPRTCDEQKVDCYMGVYRDCHSSRDDDPCVAAGYVRCTTEVTCAGVSARPCPGGQCPPELVDSRTLNEIARFNFDPGCSSRRAKIEEIARRSLTRLDECFRNAFVRADIVKDYRETLKRRGVTFECHPLMNPRFCAAGGIGVVVLPPKYFDPNGVCGQMQDEMMVHEIAHNTHMSQSGSHNEAGEAGGHDEIYSLVRYCMNPARMWISRAARTADVVEPSKLACVRRYQEKTPETLEDPFWRAMMREKSAGRNPCP